MRAILLLSLVLAPFFLALGIVLPLVRFETLYLFDREPSLIDIVTSLVAGRDYALAAVIFLVSILFPLVKLVIIAANALADGAPGQGILSGRAVRLLPHLARWSLMDVLLVALVIVAAKTGGIATALSQPGLWFYAGSTLTAAVAHAATQNLAARPAGRVAAVAGKGLENAGD